MNDDSDADDAAFQEREEINSKIRIILKNRLAEQELSADFSGF